MPKKVVSKCKVNVMNNDAKLLKLDLFSKFYNNKDNLKKVIDIVRHDTDHSLRILEWFCSNYSKKYNIVYKITPTKEINVWLDYKACLDSYTKKKFDPFKRDHDGYAKFEVSVNYPDLPLLKKWETTVGQLNFFRWCIKNKILDYVLKNLKKIKDDMNQVTLKNYPDKTKTTKKIKKISTALKEINSNTVKTRKKRVSLSSAATRTCIKNPSVIKVLKF